MEMLRSRDLYLRQLLAIDAQDAARNMVRILTGVRRCGKSSLLRLYEKHLRDSGTGPEQIMSINFEELSQDKLRDPQVFHEAVDVAVVRKKIRYLHVDEVQELEDWARTLNSLRENTPYKSQ